MNRPLLVVGVVVALSGAVGACNAFGGQSDGQSEVPLDASVDSTTSASTTDGSVLPMADAAPPACATTTETFTVEADALLANATDQNFGASDQAICNIGIGECIIRFPLSSAVVTALRTKQMQSATLTLYRAISDKQCNKGADGGCLAAPFAEAGALQASPMRSDWDETQATWLHLNKMAGTSWGTAGAKELGVDRDGVVGTAIFTAVELKTAVALDVTSTNGIASKWADGNKLSLVIELTSGAYVFVTTRALDGGTTAPTTPARLDITYCVGDGG